MVPRLKVCCIASVEEARLAVQCGAAALGLVSEMPSGPGPIPDDLIAEIAGQVPPPVATFLLTYRTGGEEIVDQIIRCKTNTVQLVDEVDPDAYGIIRRHLPGVRIVQVLHVMDETAIDEALGADRNADALLLDSGNPRRAVKELGGTGRVHDWEISRRIVSASRRPVFLAGGIKPENAADAVRAVRPFGIDVCTGVRTDDRLDVEKLRRLAVAMTSAGSDDKP